MKYSIFTLIAILTISFASDIQTDSSEQNASFDAEIDWSAWISEETGGGWGMAPIKAVQCGGKYCDNQRFIFGDLGHLIDSFPKEEIFTDQRDPKICRYNPFSGKDCGKEVNLSTCPSGYFVIGWKCEGRFCDDKALYCGTFQNAPAEETPREVNWQDWFSDEDGGQQWCPEDQYVIGVACEGHYCDNMKLQCAAVAKKHAYY